MKIDIRSNASLYIEQGKFTYYIDVSLPDEASIQRWLTDDENDSQEIPTVIWTGDNLRPEILD